jgi:hypothetical protein
MTSSPEVQVVSTQEPLTRDNAAITMTEKPERLVEEISEVTPDSGPFKTQEA